ncbi:phage tail tape measure protein [Providencia sp. PROV266]|uniref:phage tail tape measure protein n=1 Tax=Providencia sp. PROV266 TaxID=2949954 RepID=UPI0023497001|nr:phage tail tape measure protein [Providencia sp. PROV266]
MAEQTSRLAIILDSSKAQRSTESLASALNRLTQQGEKAAESTDNLGFSFKRLISSAAGAMSVAAVIKMADDWGQVAAQVKMTLKSVEGDIENYANVQQRFLEISNRNGKDIEITQKLYIGAAASMKELGYSTEQTIDYVESLSSTFTANATSTMATDSAINAFNKSMIAGKVAGDNWNAVMNAAPTILGNIARELERTNGGMKVTENEVKKLGSEGKISFKLMADSIQRAKEANNALADSMDNTVADGFTKLTNSAKAYYGEINQSMGITRSLSAGMGELSNNFDMVSTALTGIVGIGVARYFGNLTQKMYDNSKQSVTNALNSRKEAAETVKVSQAIITRSQSEKAFAITTQQSLAAQLKAVTTETQRTTIRAQMAANSTRITLLTQAETVATNNLAAAQARLSIASNILRGGLSLIGGPAGAAMIAASAVFYFYQKSQQAKEEALAFADSLDDVRNNFDKLTFTGLAGTISDATRSVREQRNEIERTKEEIEWLRKRYKIASDQVDIFGDKSEVLAAIQEDISSKTAELERKTNKLSDTIKFAADAQYLLSSKVSTASEAFNLAANSTGNYASALGVAIKFMNDAKHAKTALDMEMMTTPTPEEAYGDEAARIIKDLQRNVELAEMADRARYIAQAKYRVEEAGGTPQAIIDAGKLAEEAYDKEENRRKLSKEYTSSLKQNNDAAQKLLETLKEQQVALLIQKELGKDIGSQEQAKATFLDKIKRMEEDQAKGKLTAEQKSLLANKELIQAEYDRNIQLEQYIKNKELEVKIAAFHKQIAEESILVQEQYNQTLAMAGKGNLEQGRLQARFQVQNEFQRKQADLQKQFQDKSTGMTEEMYKKETQFISDELQKRLAMLEDYHGKQDVMRGNWTLGVDTALQNYMDNARNYSQQAEGFITNSLQNITEGSADALTDLVTNSKNAFDAIGDFFGDLSKSIIKDLIRIAIQAQITNAMTGLFGGGIKGSSQVKIFDAGLGGLNAGLRGAMPIGMAHSGIDRVPETGTWLLEKGERVMTQDTSARLDKLLAEFSSGTHPDQYAMKYIHPANQTNNTTNNSNTNNTVETNENSQSSVVIYQTVNQTITVTGNGDKTLEKVVKIAIDKGSKKAIAEIQRDFATNGTTRKLLGQ